MRIMPPEEKYMRKTILAGLLCLPLGLIAQTINNGLVAQPTKISQDATRIPLMQDTTVGIHYVLDSIVVSAVRAGDKAPFASQRVGKEALRQSPASLTLPYAIDFTPGLVSVSENGTGTGYSHLRIRGSDASRTAVSLNGIPLNDAESQSVFWVNLPALTGFLEQVQVQRGVGSSTAGPGAFGGSIHMQTLGASAQAYGTADFSLGSYQSYMTAIGAGTGLLKTGADVKAGTFSFDLRYAHNQTEGYVRNGWGKMHSLFSRASYVKGKHAFRLNYLYGSQHTGITWEGVSPEMMAEDRRANPAGLYYDAAGNVHYYQNESDNYVQNHLQAFYIYSPAPGWHWSNTLHYTRGDGYYENYKRDRKFSAYALGAQTVDAHTYSRSDLVQQSLMGNDYYAFSSVLHAARARWSLQAGLNYALYQGNHFGDVIWAMYNQNIPQDYEWYRNASKKQDFSAFAKWQYAFIPSLSASVDLQYRYIDYRLEGIDKDLVDLSHQAHYSFLNPKLGLHYKPVGQHQAFASLSVGQKEPSRGDFKEAIKAQTVARLLSEKMWDWELGYRYEGGRLNAGVNLYYMDYENQLVATGKLTETGYVIQENVPSSFRAGIELTASWQAISFFGLDGNISLSKNKIKEYTAWVDAYDNAEYWTPLPQQSQLYHDVDLAYSPGCVAMLQARVQPWQGLSCLLRGKYVGQQYYDNTQSSARSLPAYWTGSLRLQQQVSAWKAGQMEVSLLVDNIFNRKYVANAWVYRAVFADGSPDYVEQGLFPQAEINFMLGLTLRF
jgi:Outer membrane receptor proteins, mostly Fe transport